MSDSTYISPSRRASCAGCSADVMRTRTSAEVIYCRDCRRDGKAPSKVRHGTGRRYAHGCRCEVCRSYKRDRSRIYVAYRAESGNPVVYRRRREPASCRFCGVTFEARVDSTRSLYCSLTCANDAQGRRENPRFRIADSIRLAIYEQDAWVCQLCTIPVDRDAHHLAPTAPTLDHIQPRARGGSDEPNNLRLACRDCNTKRGTDLEWKPARIA